MFFVLLSLTACANIEPPPGGPRDVMPPALVATVPESLGSYPDFGGRVEFLFDEVVSEGSSPNLGLGNGDLERLIVLSPSERVPRISWRRTRIAVKPREGWQPNRTYRVELLPGITDLARNRSTVGAVVTFTTGGPLPTDTLRGRIVDWTQGRPAAGALIVAVLIPDSLTYRTIADSSGNFVLGPVPADTFLVFGVVDQDRNARRDNRELFDSIRVAPPSRDLGSLWAFPHDTTPPRIDNVTARDSLSANITFTQFLDPEQRFDPSSVRVVELPDSTPVSVVSLLTSKMHDSLYAAIAEQDSTTGRDSTNAVDSVDAVRPQAEKQPVDSTLAALAAERPTLYKRLMLRIGRPWVPENSYYIEIEGVRNVNGFGGTAGGGLVVPAPPPPLEVPSDSVAPDSVRREVGDSLPGDPDQ